MAWGAAIGAIAGYMQSRQGNDSRSSTNMTTENNPWQPTIQGRQEGLGAAHDIFQQRFGTPARSEWVPNGTPSQGGPKGTDPYGDPVPGGGGNGSGDYQPGQFHIETTPASPGSGFQYGVPRPGQTAQLNIPGAATSNEIPRYGGTNLQGGPRGGGGGGGGGRGGGGGGATGHRGGPSTPTRDNRMTQDLWDAGSAYNGPEGLSDYRDAVSNYDGPAGLEDLRNMAGNVDNNNPYLDDAYNRNADYHGSQSMQDLMGREMDRQAGGYETDDFRAAQDRISGYGGPAGLTDFRDRLLRDSAGNGSGANQGGGGGGGGNNTPRMYNPNAHAQYQPGGGGGAGSVGRNDPSLGNGQGTYDPFVQQTLRAEDPWSSRLKTMADAQYEMAPETQAMLDMQQRRMQEQLAPELASLAWNAESSGRFGSDAYQMAQAQSAGRVAQSVGDMRTQMSAADLGQFRQGQQFALGQGSQNYNNALGIGASLQNNRADNQTSMANAQTAAQASGAASAAAAGMQQAALAQQGSLAREQMALQAFGMQGQADQFSIGGQMDAAQFGMNYDADRTGQLMNYTGMQTNAEMGALGNMTSLAGTYGDQNLAGQQLAMQGMGQAVGYGLQGDQMRLNGMGQAVGMGADADAQRFGVMGQAAGLQNQWGLGMAGIASQDAASRRSAGIQRQGMNMANQQHSMDQNFQAQMAQWQMGQEQAQQQAMMNWGAGRDDQAAMQQWEANNFAYNDTAPMAFLSQYADLQNAYGSGGGTSWQHGSGTTSGPQQSAWAGAIGGAAAGYGWDMQRQQYQNQGGGR